MPAMTTDKLIDALEQRVDQHRLTFSLARHPGLWVATARFADGRQISLQDAQRAAVDLTGVTEVTFTASGPKTIGPKACTISNAAAMSILLRHLGAITETIALRTRHLARLARLATARDSLVLLGYQAWFRRLSRFALPRPLPDAPVALFPTESPGGYLGELAISGLDVINSGSAQTEFRYTAWPADAVGQVMAADGGAVWTHNLATQNHITLVLGDGSGRLGDVWVARGSNADAIHRSGSYAGPLTLLAIRGVNPRCVAQYDYMVDAAGKLIAADADTVPLGVAQADPGGRLGELYAEREAAGWRIRRSGAVNVNCRIAVLKLT